MSTVSYNKPLIEADRQIIVQWILNNSSIADIAHVLGKDKSTISKEIKLHRVRKYKSSLPLNCANYKTCTHRRQYTLQYPYSSFHFVTDVIVPVPAMAEKMPLQA